MKEYLLKQAAVLRAEAAKLEKQHADLTRAARFGGTLYFEGHEPRFIVDGSGVLESGCDPSASRLSVLMVNPRGQVVNRFRSLEDLAKEVGVGKMYQIEPKRTVASSAAERVSFSFISPGLT